MVGPVFRDFIANFQPKPYPVNFFLLFLAGFKTLQIYVSVMNHEKTLFTR